MEINYYKQGSVDVLAVLDFCDPRFRSYCRRGRPSFRFGLRTWSAEAWDKTRSLRTETKNFESQDGGDALRRPDQKKYLPVALAAEANKSENFIFRKSLSNLSN